MGKAKVNELALAQIDGFPVVVESVTKLVHQQKDGFVKIAIHGMKIGELIMNFAARPELIEAVDQYNAERQKSGLGGRPKLYHSAVAEQIVSSGVSISKKWLERCARAYVRMMALGVDGEKILTLPVAAAEKTPLIEEFLPAGFAEDDDADDPAAKAKKALAFKELVSAMVSKLDAIRAQAGEVSLKNKRNQEQLAAALEDWFERNGVRASISFKH